MAANSVAKVTCIWRNVAPGKGFTHLPKLPRASHTFPYKTWRTVYNRNTKLVQRAHAFVGRVTLLTGPTFLHIQRFREKLSEKMCTRQSSRVMWDMINTLLLTLKLSILLLLLSFRTRKHKSMASRAILSNFFEEQ